MGQPLQIKERNYGLKRLEPYYKENMWDWSICFLITQIDSWIAPEFLHKFQNLCP